MTDAVADGRDVSAAVPSSKESVNTVAEKSEQASIAAAGISGLNQQQHTDDHPSNNHKSAA